MTYTVNKYRNPILLLYLFIVYGSSCALNFYDFFDERVVQSYAFDLHYFIVNIKDTGKLHNFCAMQQLKKKTSVMSMWFI